MEIHPLVLKAEADRLTRVGADPAKHHMCYKCQLQYKRLIENGTLQCFPIKCALSHDIQASQVVDSTANDLQKLYIESAIDPDVWINLDLGMSTKGRPYQSEILRCSADKIIGRCGRRLGKTWGFAMKGLHLCVTTEKLKILVVAPFQTQANLIFDIICELIDGSVTCKSMLKPTRKAPYYSIPFDNGSAFTIFTAGVKSKGGADKIRGFDANIIWIDEADQLHDDHIVAILAILTSHSDCELWSTGTPTGKRAHYYQWSTDPSCGFRAFHVKSSEGPEWSTETESFLRNTYSESTYKMEYEADFPQLAEGIFPARLVDAAIVPARTIPVTPQPSWTYGLGVDWNATEVGCHIRIIGWNPATEKFVDVGKRVVSKEVYTQTAAVDKIRELNGTWNPKFIYVDAGFGDMQVEVLHQYGRADPSTDLLNRVKAIQMGGNIKVMSPLLGMVDKPAKPFIVGLAVRRLEQGVVEIPDSEKTTGSEGLIDQMLLFAVKSYSDSGRPIYTQGNDHSLTAWMLAIYGFWIECTNLFRQTRPTGIKVVQNNGATTKKSDPIPLQEDLERLMPAIDRTPSLVAAPDRGIDATTTRDKSPARPMIPKVGGLRVVPAPRSVLGDRPKNLFGGLKPHRRSSF